MPGSPLVTTKLHVPAVRDRLPRTDLVNELRDVPRCKLGLIRAPAGWGKSTLLAQWCSADERPFGWVTLDSGDNDPVRFWTWAIEALRSVDSSIGGRSLALLQAPGVDLATDVLPLLVAELAELPAPTVLALDDYHLVTNEDVQASVRLLLDHLPPTLELAIATRTEPPLALTRLRAGGELAEVDVDWLRFSNAEAGEFLNGVLGLGLAAEAVALLRERTEGWPAGIYLAALSLDGREDAHDFIARFAAGDRDVRDHLSEEVLTGQPEEVRAFLTRTSVLDRLSGPLCDAVAGTEGSSRLLERSNLFVVPLGDRGEWYRYHDVFRACLDSRLRVAEPDAIVELQRRAAAWLLDDGQVSEAIHQTIAAGDTADAGEVIAEHWSPTIDSGDRYAVMSWLDAVGEDAIRADARLAIAQAWTQFADGRLPEALEWTEAALRAPLPGPFRDGNTSTESAAAVLLASYWLLSGDAGKAQEHSRRALEIDSSPWRAVAASCLGAASHWLGDRDEAMRWFDEAVGSAREDGRHVLVVYAVGHHAIVRAESEEWDLAEQLAGEAYELVEELGAHEHWAGTNCGLARGMLHEHAGRLDEADAEMTSALELSRRGLGPVQSAYVLTSLARVRRLQDDSGGALGLETEARVLIDACPDPGVLVRGMLEGRERRFQRPPAAAPASRDELSERELAVLRLLPSGLTQREIGDALYVSVNTVRSHTKNIFRKLGVSSREEAVERAREGGVL